MTPTDIHHAAARKATRELIRPLESKLAQAERTISALVDKLAKAERELLEVRMRLVECYKKTL